MALSLTMRSLEHPTLHGAPLELLDNRQLHPLLEVPPQHLQLLGGGPRLRLRAVPLSFRHSDSLLCLSDLRLSSRDLLGHGRSQETGLFTNSLKIRRAGRCSRLRSPDGLLGLPSRLFDLDLRSHRRTSRLGRLPLQKILLRLCLPHLLLQRSLGLLLSLSHVLQVAFACSVTQVRFERCGLPRAHCQLPLLELRGLGRQAAFESCTRSRRVSSLRGHGNTVRTDVRSNILGHAASTPRRASVRNSRSVQGGLTLLEILLPRRQPDRRAIQSSSLSVLRVRRHNTARRVQHAANWGVRDAAVRHTGARCVRAAMHTVAKIRQVRPDPVVAMG
mmetsp:Transcript_49391/g.131033  ORF Transcript_49391/g.131033 Transcript_49391/m.131033 type:complete len:332 (+) Transcript_49391:1031-2026(+)